MEFAYEVGLIRFHELFCTIHIIVANHRKSVHIGTHTRHPGGKSSTSVTRVVVPGHGANDPVLQCDSGFPAVHV
ncbi:MAG: hypothetical protein LUE17_01640, partial [Planctomycetaceae bacterium]|nr:hypothetical protein [Planctomycetaceae bacterium]